MFEVPHLCHLLVEFLSADLRKGEVTENSFQCFQFSNHYFCKKNIVDPSIFLGFLGITLDTVTFELLFHQNFLFWLEESSKFFLGISKCTKQDLLSLLSYISFVTKVAVKERGFPITTVLLSSSSMLLCLFK